MTSSLVGSEMCIRDSLSCLVLGRSLGRWRRPPCPRARRLRHSPVPTMPVSYTHLTLPTICSV
eukprot:10743666-Prorocentrum_lima.AAC.1